MLFADFMFAITPITKTQQGNLPTAADWNKGNLGIDGMPSQRAHAISSNTKPETGRLVSEGK